MEQDALTIWNNSLSNKAENTRITYSKHFKKFLEWANISPKQVRHLKLEEEQGEKKPWERTQVENLVRQFLGYLEEEGKAGSTRRTALVSIQSFFKAQNLPLHLNGNDYAEAGYVKGSSTPNHQDIKRMVNACSCIRDRALILFLKDSGLRESDVEGLLWKQLKPYAEGFYSFKIETQKKNVIARGFVGQETIEMLEAYRRKRLHGTQKVPQEESLTEHPVFAQLSDGTKPMNAREISWRIGRIIRHAGLEDKGLTAHGLRKFWEKRIHAEKEAYQKQLNGRKLNSVETSYYRLEVEELFQIYRANYDNLRVLTLPVSKEIARVEERIREEYEEQLRRINEKLERAKNLAITPFRDRASIEELVRLNVCEELKKRGLSDKYITED